MDSTTFETNVNGVRLKVSEYGDRFFFVYANGPAQDIRQILRDDVLKQITDQIRAARDFNAECARKDESVPPLTEEELMSRAMARDGSDGPVAGPDGYGLDYDHDPEFCDDPLCEEDACVKARAATEGDAAYHARIDDEVEDLR